MGNPIDAALAIHRAFDSRETIDDGPGRRSDLDEIGGILSFAEPKQLFYAAYAYRRIGKTEVAIRYAREAMKAYVSGPPQERSYGDETLARIDLAILHSSGAKPDLAATAEDLQPVVSLPPALHPPTLTDSLNHLKALVSGPRLAPAPEAPALLADIGTVLSNCQPPRILVQA